MTKLAHAVANAYVVTHFLTGLNVFTNCLYCDKIACMPYETNKPHLKTLYWFAVKVGDHTIVKSKLQLFIFQ